MQVTAWQNCAQDNKTKAQRGTGDGLSYCSAGLLMLLCGTNVTHTTNSTDTYTTANTTNTTISTTPHIINISHK